MSLVLAIVLLALPAIAWASHNDSINAPQQLGVPAVVQHDNNTATALDPPDNNECEGPAGRAGFGATVWYILTGTGRPITVSLGLSDFDTVLGVYRQQSPGSTSFPFLGCNDDLASDNFRSEFVINSDSGLEYLIQVGGCTILSTCGPPRGEIVLTAWEPPGNDLRSGAEPVTFGAELPSRNLGALTENPEHLECEGGSYGKTVWFRFDVAARGTVTVTAAGSGLVDTVVSLYGGDSPSPLPSPGCNRAPPGGSSRLERYVTPGRYYVQVGGQGAGLAAQDGSFDLAVNFQLDRDLDRDGVPTGVDCSDDPSTDPNAAQRKPGPGNTDPRNDGIDQNCDGVDGSATDRDGDNFDAPPTGRDCDDADAARNPGAFDDPRTALDENCDLRPGSYQRLRVDIIPRWRPGLARGGTAVTRLSVDVSEAERGARVTVRCRGRGCPRRIGSRIVGRAARISFTRAFRKRSLRAGATIEVRVTLPNSSRRTSPGFEGVGRRFTMRRNRFPSIFRGCISPVSAEARLTRCRSAS